MNRESHQSGLDHPVKQLQSLDPKKVYQKDEWDPKTGMGVSGSTDCGEGVRLVVFSPFSVVLSVKIK